MSVKLKMALLLWLAPCSPWLKDWAQLKVPTSMCGLTRQQLRVVRFLVWQVSIPREIARSCKASSDLALGASLTLHFIGSASQRANPCPRRGDQNVMNSRSPGSLEELTNYGDLVAPAANNNQLLSCFTMLSFSAIILKVWFSSISILSL